MVQEVDPERAWSTTTAWESPVALNEAIVPEAVYLVSRSSSLLPAVRCGEEGVREEGVAAIGLHGDRRHECEVPGSGLAGAR